MQHKVVYTVTALKTNVLSLCAGPFERRLMVCVGVLLWMGLVGCSRSLDDVQQQMPSCQAACANEARNASFVELNGQDMNVWAAGVKDRPSLEGAASIPAALAELERLDVEVGKRLGLSRSSVLHVLCHANTPASRILDLLRDEGGAHFPAVSLAGKGKAGVGFVALARHTKEQADAAVKAKTAMRLDGAVGDLKSCKRNTMASPCPNVLIKVEGQTCGQLIAQIDQGATAGRLFILETDLPPVRSPYQGTLDPESPAP